MCVFVYFLNIVTTSFGVDEEFVSFGVSRYGSLSQWSQITVTIYVSGKPSFVFLVSFVPCFERAVYAYRHISHARSILEIVGSACATVSC